MGLGHCKTNNSTGRGHEFVAFDFKREIEKEIDESRMSRDEELHDMLQVALKKDKEKNSKYFSIRSVAKTIGCDHSSLSKWLESHRVKTEKMVTHDSHGQGAIVLTKEQVQFVMENKGFKYNI